MNIKSSHKTGLSFGVTSGVITTLGLLIGLARATGSKSVAIIGILSIAIADGLSDSFGIHISEESKTQNNKEVWEATVTTLFFKFFTALSFLVPLLILDLNLAILAGSIWGIFLLSFLSYQLSKSKGEDCRKVIVEHVLIAILVIVTTYVVGGWLSSLSV